MPAVAVDLPTGKMLASIEDGIGWLTFNQPEKRNAVSVEMWQGVAVAAKVFAADPAVRVVVLRGAGDRAFISGADISQFEKMRPDADAQAEFDRLTLEGRQALVQLEKPLIAMIHGYCLGGGVVVAMQADIRVASDQSTFGIPAARLGIAYTPDNVERLLQLVGPGYAREMLFTARQYSGQEALAMGLVNHIVPAADLERAAREMAATIAENAPLSVRASKLTIAEMLKGPGGRDDALIQSLIDACLDSSDYREGRRAFMEKRRAQFMGK